MILRGTLADIAAQVEAAGISRTALILVGRVLDAESFPDSLLYDPGFSHLTRARRGEEA
jgi:precorrin-4/cobalt-precorrin-4 C11-methyltransferase